MTENELYDLLDSWVNIQLLILRICNNPDDFDVLVNLAFNDSRQKSWRAAYLIDQINDQFPQLVTPLLPAMIEQLKIENNASKRRHWLKLISMNTVPEQYLGFLFDYCIEAFTSAKEAVAVRVHAMQILFNISETEPELKSEVIGLIEQEIHYHPTAGIRSRGAKLLKKLHRQTN